MQEVSKHRLIKHLPLWQIMLASVIFMLSIPQVQAQSQPVSHSLVKPSRVQSNASANSRSFTIQETYQQTVRSPMEPLSPGIVGLDMLIQTGNYPLVQAVLPGTPADKHGVRAGDILIAINGASTRNQDSATIDAMISDVPGETVQLKLLRHGQLKSINLVVISLSDLSRDLQTNFSSLLPKP
jgi:S1-C subfamily serine protease